MGRKIKLSSQPEEIIKKKKWDRKYVIRTAIYASVGTVALQVYTRLGYHFNLQTNDTMRYLSQLAWIIMAVCYVLALLSFRKAIPKIYREYVFGGARWVFQKIGAGLAKMTARLREMLGFPSSHGQRIKGIDEKTFVFDANENSLLRRIRHLQNRMRWKDLTDNADKIRFLYVKFINRLVSKKKLKYNAVLTPCELGSTVSLGPDEGAGMFWLYTGARYSGGIYPITDDDVKAAMAMASGKEPKPERQQKEAKAKSKTKK
ncbi:MAG: hypothetical protein ACOYID_04485 [Eubacteriales bacterium]|nr:hypothetical protein [Clostridiales bacterium]